MKIKPLYIIPARGGSKGIPGKNIIDLCGKPLIAYTIDAALQVASPDRILLSTDSDVIAEVAAQCGLPTDYRRPKALATDTAGSREVILDAMDYADKIGLEYNAVVLLQPTSPLRTSVDILSALQLYSTDIDMVVTVCESRANPYYNCFETDDNGYLHISKGEGLISRRQDALHAWEYNGAVYVINPESIRKMSLGEFPRRVPSVMPLERSIDIDSPLDLAIARYMLNCDSE